MVLGANPQRKMSQTRSYSQGGASLHIGKATSGRGQGRGNGKVGFNGESGEATIPCQRHGNWEPTKVLALISYKHVEQVVQRKLIDTCTHMVSSVQLWEKIVDELQKKIKSKFPRNNTTCKDKWNAFNSYYKKFANYHKGIRNRDGKN
jgi:hypothetical protein